MMVQLWEIEKVTRSLHIKVNPTAELKYHQKKIDRFLKARPVTEGN